MSSSLPPTSAPPSRGMPDPSVRNLISRFDDTHISPPRDAGFIGGFNPLSGKTPLLGGVEKPLPATPDRSIPAALQPGHGRAQQTPFIASSKSSQHDDVSMPSPKLSMPMPNTEQSLTMAYAKSAPPDVIPLPISQPDRDLLPPYFRHQYHLSAPSTTASSPIYQPHTPPQRTRSSSTPPSPTSTTGSAGDSNSLQCSGTTKAGKRCRRPVKAPPLVSFFAPPLSEPVERFCFQHVKEVLEQSGFYSHKEGGGWVEFSEWIPEYLHPDTKAALRVEMEKPASPKDEPGYIYAYEIRDDRMPDEIMIKVGRAVKLAKRLDEWSKQCTSKEVILRGWWPGTVEDDNGRGGTSLLRGRIKAGEKGPMCHRLERLVHLELADLVVHAPYLQPGFPDINTQMSGAGSATSTPGRSSKSSKVRMPNKPCVDCGAVHKEIFAFQRPKKGKYKDKEWEKLVQPVITKWGKFVAELV